MGSAVSIVLETAAVTSAVDELPGKRQRGYGKKLIDESGYVKCPRSLANGAWSQPQDKQTGGQNGKD